jgi:hypothetical protein
MPDFEENLQLWFLRKLLLKEKNSHPMDHKKDLEKEMGKTIN